LRGRLRRCLLLALVFLVLCILLGTESYLYSKPKSPEAQWLDYVFYPLPLWMPWTLLAPVVIMVARRFRLDRRLEFKTSGITFAASLGIFGRHLVGMGPLIALQISFINGVPLLKAAFKYFGNLPLEMPMAWALRNLITYCVILAVSYTANYRKELKDREVQASRLEGQLAKAQLHSLKSQLHPHFLFNSLNAISTLMRTDMDSAERMLDMVAELLRRSLRESAVQEVPLSREVEFVSRYLEIEQVRFSNRLKVEIQIPPELEQALVPHLILQPLVENAIRHGIGPKLGPGTVRIEARREASRLVLQVSDDGPGTGTRRSAAVGEGVGLSNTRARLEQLFEAQASLEFGPVSTGGFLVCVRLPFRLAFGESLSGAAPMEGSSGGTP